MKTSQSSSQLDLISINKTLNLISGKWKAPIIGTLSMLGRCRFSEIQKNIGGIGSKMLSKELKTLEINELIKRTVIDTTPVTIEYELTLYGQTLDTIILELSKWGKTHHNRTTGTNPDSEINHFLTFDI